MRHSPGHHPASLKKRPALPVRSDQLAELFAEPSGKVYLLYGSDLAFSLSLRMAAQAMAQGSPIAVVDGANRFNVHLLARFARERRLDPDAFLHRIYVSRGFTCYQMEQAVVNRLPAFLRSIGSRTALVFGLLDTLYDDQAPLREVQQILRRLLAAFAHMKAEGTSVLIVSTEWHVEPKERNALFTTLKEGMDRVVRLQEDEGALRLIEERKTGRALNMEDGRLTIANGV